MIDRLLNRRGLRGNTILRAADRYMGIPFLKAAGAVRHARSIPERIEHIGVLNSTNIGDTVVLSPVLADLAASLPQARVNLFTSSASAAIAELTPGVTSVPIKFASPLDAVRTIRNQHLDVLLDFDSWPRIEPIYAVFSRARYAAGFRTAGHHRHFAYDMTVDHSRYAHEIDNYRNLVRLLGVESTSNPFLPRPGLLSSSDLPADPYVVFHMWPTGQASHLKEWAPASWRNLALELSERGCSVVLTGSPADAEPTERFISASPSSLRTRMLSVAGAYDLTRVLDILAGSRCVVSVNTGIAHMAAAVGAATVCLNGPTDPNRWGPIGEQVRCVNSSFDGCGYLYLGSEYKGNRTDCMDGIELDRVRQAVESLLENE